MREAPRAVLLALLLCAGAALAQEEAPLEEEVTEVLVEEAVEEEEEEEPGYMEVVGRPELLAEGVLKASVEAALRPPRGYTPVAVTLHNSGATPRAVRLGFEARGTGRGEVASREAEVGPRQRVVTWLHIPTPVRSGTLRLRGADTGEPAVAVYLPEAPGAVLVLGTERAFGAGTGLGPVKRPRLSVLFLEPAEAPRELAAYVGFPAVVVAGEVTALPADAWAALEAYAATGGRLALLRPPRDVGGRLPLLAATSSGEHPYGFGQVRLCAGADACGAGLLADVRGALAPVEPGGPAWNWARGRNPLHDGRRPLLPGVRAPVGRFLLLILLFVLAVGPGGLLLARRRGPVAVLVAVPAVALLTCLAIVAWAVLVEGFSTHAARYSLTWLDRARDRAVTLGVGGYYAHLPPEGLRLPVLAALLAPSRADESQYAQQVDWTQGLEVRDGLLPPRAYREWGEVAVVPTRARLSVRREEGGPRVRNALGAPLLEGYVRVGGELWTVPALADGAEALATPAPASAALLSEEDFLRLPGSAPARFAGVPWSRFQELPEGGFLVKLGGVGPGPLSALPVELHEGVHLVYGRVDS